jgi:hypothetical protein
MTPEAVADATLRAIQRGRNEITLSANGRLLIGVNRLIPRFVDWGLARWTRRLYANTAALEEAETVEARTDPRPRATDVREIVPPSVRG